MEAIIGIIVAVIAFIFYIARSVEQQNARERKRRQERRAPRRQSAGPQPVPSPSNTSSAKREEPEQAHTHTDSQPGSTIRESRGDRLTQFQEAQKRISHLGDQEQPGESEASVDLSSGKSSPVGRKPVWLNDRRHLRDAFILSECIGKPRAINPHTSLKIRRHPHP